MLAKRRGFYAGDKEVIRTPLLLPSFSSKGFPAINKIFQTMQEVIDGEVLISAYTARTATNKVSWRSGTSVCRLAYEGTEAVTACMRLELRDF